jgi:uncharacterized protein YllA (UPF0747 family)
MTAKKIETDTLTKAISKLWFNADIFMGKFDDLRYIEEMNEEFKLRDAKKSWTKEAKLLEEKQAKEVSDRIERNAIRLNVCEKRSR